MNLTITFPQLAAALAQATGSSQSTAETFIRQLFDYISSELLQGRSVSIKGLGAFSLGMSPENPILWQPAPELAEAVNQPFAFFEPVELNDGVTEEVLATPPSTDTDKKEDEPSAVSEVKTDDNDTLPAPESDDTQVTGDTSDDEESPEAPDEESDEALQEQEEPSTVDDAQPQDESTADDQPAEATDFDETPDYQEEYAPQQRFNPWFALIIGLAIGLVAGYYAGYRWQYYPWVTSTQYEPQAADTIIYADKALDSVIVNVDSLSAVTVDSSAVVEPTAVVPEAITDTITVTRFLTTMSRKYYGDHRFWVYIYEENAPKLRHPDKIRPGTVVVIPPAEKYGIDVNDPESVKKASSKIGEIYSRFDK